jgi:hypothetical protein
MNLLISFIFHSVIVVALIYFAAREGLLGKQLKKIAVEIVKDKEPEKPRPPEKPPEQPPKAEIPKIAEIPKTEAPRTVAAAPPASGAVAPPTVAPPPAEVPSFEFGGGKAVQSSSDPVQIYRGYLEYSLRSNWNRPADLADDDFVAEVEVSVDRDGRLSDPEWKKGSGDARWDASVRAALAATKALDRPPPANFPDRVLVRFDVQEETEPAIQ